MPSRTRTTPVLAAALALAVPALAQEKEHPIATQVKASLKDPAKPFTLVISFRIKADSAAKFEAAFTKAAGPTRKEKGNRAYELSRAGKGSAEYVLYERWQDLAALQAHLQTPYITTLLAEMGDMLDGPPDLRVFVPVGN